VWTGNRTHFVLLLCAVTVLLYSCTPGDFIRPNPPPSLDRPPEKQNDAESIADSTVLDFGTVFDSGYEADDDEEYGYRPPPGESGTITHDGKYKVSDKKVRVAILRSIGNATVYSVGTVYLNTGSKPFRGRIAVERTAGKTSITSTTGRFEVALPCTLKSENDYNFMDIENTTYRGSLIIIPEGDNRITLVNMLDVEEYLRGVLPLELGKCSMEEVEALKAQAVAARTYTYRRMAERRSESFDLVNTVADQVYGGASVEYRESDAAVKATADKILMYGDSIIYAYYHSTCGGTTATIDEVWNKPHQPYLVSISDKDKNDIAYCSGSTYFTWNEEWQWKSFSTIIQQNLRKMYPDKRFDGPVTNVSVKDRFSCGRIRTLVITAKGWIHEARGDEIRFILRRAVRGNPILRSASFSVDDHGKAIIRLKGRGYGHGVGLCQTGAIGRARQGQQYHEILGAYYPGTTLITVVKKEEGIHDEIFR